MPQRVVVTAGPTREHVDPVRYLSNESTGKMGFEVARAASEMGHKVILVSGPVHLRTPRGVRRVDVTSAREMLVATRRAFHDADMLVMTAAVSDWRPRRKRSGKWRGKDRHYELAIDLVRNPDILATLARRKGSRLVIGFALETGGGLDRAKRKLARKNVDYIVLNDASALGADRTSVTVLGRDGTERRLRNRTKRAIARALLSLPHPGERSRAGQ